MTMKMIKEGVISQRVSLVELLQGYKGCSKKYIFKEMDTTKHNTCSYNHVQDNSSKIE